MDKWKNLKEHEDFDILKRKCSDEDLDLFEEELIDFLNSNEADIHEDNYPPIACWYNGMWSTDDLLDFYVTN